MYYLYIFPLHGFKGISFLAKACIYLFLSVAFVLLFGGETRYIIETGFSSLGRMIQNFLNWPHLQILKEIRHFLRTGRFFYWAYWMVWCVAAPFLSEIYLKGEPCGRQSWAVMFLGLVQQLSVLLY